MLSTLHYGLNTALTEVDSTYEIVTTAEFMNDITLTEENSFTNEHICVFFDKTLQSIKNYTSSSELVERKIHEINLEIVSYNDSTATIKTTVKFSGGELYATSDLDWTGAFSPYLAKFDQNTVIPWVAKSTAEQRKFDPTRVAYNYFNHLLNFNKTDWNINASALSALQNKLSNDKAAHDYLSSNALCWVNPAIPRTTAITISKIVPSDKKINSIDTKVSLINTENTKNDPENKISPFDVAVSCGNPTISGQEKANDIQASALLSYYETEAFYNLSDFRNVSGAQMNFFWKNRDKIIKVAFNKKATKLNSNLNSFQFGFYAVSEVNYVAQQWVTAPIYDLPNGVCQNIECSPGHRWAMCKFEANYRADVVFTHYSYQPLPPSYWRNLQKVVL